MASKSVYKKKNFIVEHKVALLAVGLVGMTGVALMLRGGLKQHDDFLRVKGLYEEFYTQKD